MGWISSAVLNSLVTVVVIGALKRSGVVKVDTKCIKNDTARTMFEAAVDLGENIAEKGERLWKEIAPK